MCAVFREDRFNGEINTILPFYELFVFTKNIEHSTESNFWQTKRQQRYFQAGQFRMLRHIQQRKCFFIKINVNMVSQEIQFFYSQDLNTAGEFRPCVCVWFVNHTREDVMVPYNVFTFVSKLFDQLMVTKEILFDPGNFLPMTYWF